MSELADEDVAYLEERGIASDEALRQVALLETPPSPARLDRAATLGDGILPLDSSGSHLEAGARAVLDGRLTRFVPASGAASRMFKDLLQVMRPDPVADAHLDETPALHEYRTRHAEFAFWSELESELTAAGFGPGDVETVAGARASLRLLLDRDPDGHGLALASRPKGLIPFHRSGGSSRTPIEEHLHEAAALFALAGGEERQVRAHFTVSPEHREAFEDLVQAIKPSLEGHYGIAFAIDFSSQSSATDTLALNPSGGIVRQESGAPLLRPGGHGALIYDLAALDADLVTIKNIDNVLPQGRQQEVVETKLALLGLAASTQAELHRHLQALHGEEPADALPAAADFAADTLGIPVGEGPEAERIATLRRELDRPLRVCGVVLNEGEPGGGPFWVLGREGYPRLQIVESSQIDASDEQQASLLAGATHFNPVDLVCALRDWRGEPHELLPLVDPATSFVAEKSVGGEPLLALERPGLWNGAMDGWHTLFVEVPSGTFAPVKTVFDLLRPTHQASS
ncbi:MAG: DUF4301 family protein [Acidobacteriota bacterium]